ncbi:MAG: IS66 family insertion sequence element accessory protein TnpB [Gemmataceae bacterium]
MPRKRSNPQLEQFWRKTIAAWEKSGQSARAFCASRELREPSFYSWRRTLRERDRLQPTAAERLPKLVPLRVVPEAVAVLEIVLPSGLVVRVPSGSDVTTVANLVAALRAATC